MKHHIKIEDQFIELDSEISYLISLKPDEQEKLFRKALNLPVRKPIVYYRDTRDEASVTKVIAIRLADVYDISFLWYTLEITLSTGEKVLIHSSFLKQMQQANFTERMRSGETFDD